MVCDQSLKLSLQSQTMLCITVYSRGKKKGLSMKIAIIVLAILIVLAVIVIILGARGINLRTETTISLSPEEAWRFFEDPQNLAKWDRSVARVEPTSSGNVSPGYTFDTIAPPRSGQKEGQRMSYEITEFIPNERAEIRLVQSPMFKRAEWTVMLEPAAQGTRVIHEVDFVPRLQYSFLVPVLLLSQKNLDTDMQYLKEQMEAYGARNTP